MPEKVKKAIISADFRSHMMIAVKDGRMKALRELKMAGVITFANHHRRLQLHLNKARVASIKNNVVSDDSRERIVRSQLLDHRSRVTTRKQHHSQQGCDVVD